MVEVSLTRHYGPLLGKKNGDEICSRRSRSRSHSYSKPGLRGLFCHEPAHDDCDSTTVCHQYSDRSHNHNQRRYSEQSGNPDSYGWRYGSERTRIPDELRSRLIQLWLQLAIHLRRLPGYRNRQRYRLRRIPRARPWRMRDTSGSNRHGGPAGL